MDERREITVSAPHAARHGRGGDENRGSEHRDRRSPPDGALRRHLAPVPRARQTRGNSLEGLVGCRHRRSSSRACESTPESASRSARAPRSTSGGGEWQASRGAMPPFPRGPLLHRARAVHRVPRRSPVVHEPATRTPEPPALREAPRGGSGLTTYAKIGYSQRTVRGICISGGWRGGPERLNVRRPRVRGLEVCVESRVLPLFVRRTEEVAGLLPQLYLQGFVQGGSELALRGPLSDGARLAPASIEWKSRRLNAPEFLQGLRGDEVR